MFETVNQMIRSSSSCLPIFDSGVRRSRLFIIWSSFSVNLLHPDDQWNYLMFIEFKGCPNIYFQYGFHQTFVLGLVCFRSSSFSSSSLVDTKSWLKMMSEWMNVVVTHTHTLWSSSSSWHEDDGKYFIGTHREKESIRRRMPDIPTTTTRSWFSRQSLYLFTSSRCHRIHRIWWYLNILGSSFDDIIIISLSKFTLIIIFAVILTLLLMMRSWAIFMTPEWSFGARREPKDTQREEEEEPKCWFMFLRWILLILIRMWLSLFVSKQYLNKIHSASPSPPHFMMICWEGVGQSSDSWSLVYQMIKYMFLSCRTH